MHTHTMLHTQPHITNTSHHTASAITPLTHTTHLHAPHTHTMHIDTPHIQTHTQSVHATCSQTQLHITNTSHHTLSTITHTHLYEYLTHMCLGAKQYAGGPAAAHACQER